MENGAHSFSFPFSLLQIDIWLQMTAINGCTSKILKEKYTEYDEAVDKIISSSLFSVVSHYVRTVRIRIPETSLSG
jgi:hypothetical protein